MFRPPYLARVAAGAVVYALEEAQKLPKAAVNLPITAVSQVLQTTMHAQQFVTSLAIKGDQVFESLTGEAAERPQWATFDEDETDPDVPDAGERSGRFALYSMGAQPSNGATSAGRPQPPAKPKAQLPEVGERLDYPSLTLAQLRARLRSLSVDELTALLDYEDATQARAPYQTLLANRIAAAKAK